MDKAVGTVGVSVVMPAYNSEKYISESITSVISQTYSNWELIIVDDGSTDKTASIVNDYAKLDTRIKYFYQHNGKQGKARNLGIENSVGIYVAFLDSDDMWLPEKLEVQLTEIQEHDADLVFSDAFLIFGTSTLSTTSILHSYKGMFQGNNALKPFFFRNGIPTLTVLAKLKCIKMVGGFSVNSSIQNAEDYHLWLKLLISGNIFYGSEKCLAVYRNHVESSTANDKQALDQFFVVLKEIGTEYPFLSPLIIESVGDKYNTLRLENFQLRKTLHLYEISTGVKVARIFIKLKKLFTKKSK